ncbi:MAG: hypothetical protein OXQ29_18665 [Rhodospirillaceae bacterium]|nr:hypothetical protein [Rhodospirillaceae bacterium]
MDMQEFTGSELWAGALQILRDRIDITHPDRPRLEPAILRQLPTERLLDLVIRRGCYDPATGEAALSISDLAEGNLQSCEITIPCSPAEWQGLRSHRAADMPQAVELQNP